MMPNFLHMVLSFSLRNILVIWYGLILKNVYMSLRSFKNVSYKMGLEIIYLIYMYKKDLALNDLQWSIYHKTKLNQTK